MGDKKEGKGCGKFKGVADLGIFEASTFYYRSILKNFNILL
jgi:hypothetical protein